MSLAEYSQAVTSDGTVILRDEQPMTPEQIVAKLNQASEPGKAMIAAEAYQIIGSLADEAGLFGKPGVQKALDYFSAIANEDPVFGEILPWDVESKA